MIVWVFLRVDYCAHLAVQVMRFLPVKHEEVERSEIKKNFIYHMWTLKEEKETFFISQRISDSVKQLFLPFCKILMSPFMSKNTASQTSAVVKESYICWLPFRMGTEEKKIIWQKTYCFWQFLFYLFPFQLAINVPPQNTHAWLSWVRFDGAAWDENERVGTWRKSWKMLRE